VLAALWAVLLFVLLMSSVSSPFVQNIAVPSYFEPGPEWTQMQNDYPTVELAIVNPSSGPGEIANPAFAREVRQTQAAGLTVLGYVHTGYGERSKAAVEKDVEKYYSWYGVDGIFFDEASTDCAKVATYYEGLYLRVKAQGGKAVVALNPGTNTSECYMAVSSVIVTFEGSYADYVREYSAPAWVSRYPPSRFWHLVHGASTARRLETAVDLGRKRRVGWMYVTPGRLPNPWDKLPTGSYWERELAIVRSG
jgi:hypothetical protein